MFTSLRKLQANRANAQKSTGAKTPEGKAASAQNRTTHGLLGQFRVLPGEHQDRFDARSINSWKTKNPSASPKSNSSRKWPRACGSRNARAVIRKPASS